MTCSPAVLLNPLNTLTSSALAFNITCWMKKSSIFGVESVPLLLLAMLLGNNVDGFTTEKHVTAVTNAATDIADAGMGVNSYGTNVDMK